MEAYGGERFAPVLPFPRAVTIVRASTRSPHRTKLGWLHPPLLPRLELVRHPLGDPGVPPERLGLDNAHREGESLAFGVRDGAHSLHVSTPVGVEPATHEV